ncbi:hypothetical protein FA95DRAFT_1507114, partial [Auriscalpium vulgare]
LLDSFHYLIAATNIITSFKTSRTDADAYLVYYTIYRQSIKELYPVRSLPNHHYAMHYPAILKHWGPLAALSEFPGERLNGELQRIKTNQHMGDLDYTMLHQISRRARLEAILHDKSEGSDESAMASLADILGNGSSQKYTQSSRLSASELADILAKAPEMNENHYFTLLQYLQTNGQPYRSWKDVPHPRHALIPSLPPRANKLRTFTIDGRTYSDRKQHEGNSAIQFWDNQTLTQRTGFIQSVWSIPLDHHMHTFIFVQPHLSLPPFDLDKAPYIHLNSFKCQIFDAQPSEEVVVIEPKHILTHITTLQRPPGAYGIQQPTLVACWALNRDRRQPS